MTVLQALIRGAIQGFSEFLPISSSGHLVLYAHFFGAGESGGLFFITALHLGTLAAVLAAFWDTVRKLVLELFKLISALFAGKLSFKKMGEERSMLVMAVVATAPLAAAFFLRDIVDRIASDSDIVAEGVCLLVTAVLLFLAARRRASGKTAAAMKLPDALLIGFTQAAAVMPGISRSGSTMSVGILRGFSGEFMVAFSFILGIPAVIAASATEFYSATRAGSFGAPLPLIAGFAASAAAGFLSIKLVRKLVKSRSFAVFAYYLFAVGAAAVVIGIIEKL